MKKILTFITLITFVACTQSDNKTKDTIDTKTNNTEAGATKTMNELKIEELKEGTGTKAEAGKTVSVHYTGWLWSNGTLGSKFDSSLDRIDPNTNKAAPFEFELGAGKVIQGWDKGVAGMKVGGKRKLTIPPEMGYGARDLGVIPPNSTLIFEVELLDVK